MEKVKGAAAVVGTPAVILRPEAERKVYRLRCAFTVPLGLGGYELYRKTQRATEEFFRDMEKQGFRAVDGRCWRTGPHPYYEPVQLPAASRLRGLERQAQRVAEVARAPTDRARDEWQRIEGELRGALGGSVRPASLDAVDYRIIAHFWREEIPTGRGSWSTA